jgi:hypothetical protein
MGFPRVRLTVRRLMVIVAFLAILIAAFKWINDPLEKFHRRTGLRRPIGAELITSGHDQTFDGEPEFRLVFDADQYAVAEWLSRRPSGDWRGWHSGRVPHWITSMCPFAREIFQSCPIEKPESNTVLFAFRDSPIDNQYGDLIVIDQTIGRVWYCSWGY